MRGVGVAFLIVWIGCSTTSHTGSFVNNVQVVGTMLVVTSCDVAVTVTEDHEGDQSETAELAGCTYDRSKLPSDSELVLGAPEGCEASAERWLVATTVHPPWSSETRRRLWQTIPRPCRAYLEEESR